ncbi:MAG: hypothetical protein JW981_10270 [Anaerolineae bacterium]|nr:hypothetical protein [Anaerolineae bacterium]
MATLPANPALIRFMKPTLDTPFHIDYAWWEKQGIDVNVELLAHLCPEHREAYQGQNVSEKIDWVDWDTGEVRQIEGLQYIITTHCSQQPGYVTDASTVLEAVFRVFLSNGNHPLTSNQLAALVGNDPDRILHILSGKVHKGLRPVLPTL